MSKQLPLGFWQFVIPQFFLMDFPEHIRPKAYRY
jgi:hypothetical protein